ncbi:MAG: MFS transporter [Phycisphaerae bacterium]|nr:MFS transporter [Phycisphaerae bacterium]
MLGPYLELPRTVHILCLGTLINRAGSFLLMFLTIYVGDRLGFGPRFATFCIGVFGFGSLCGALFGGQFADQFGRKRVMVFSLITGSLILAAFPLISSRVVMVVAILMYAMIMDMYRPATSAMISDITRPDQRGLAFGLLYIAINLGFACGAAIGGTLAKHSFVLLFLGDAATTLTYGLIILILIRESMPKRETIAGGGIARIAGCPGEAQVGSSEGSASAPAPPVSDPTDIPRVSVAVAAAHIARDWAFLGYCLGSFIGAVIFMQSMSTLPLHLKSLGFGPDEYGWLVGMNGILIVIFQLPMTSLFSRFERMKVIAIGAVILGIGFGLTAFAKTGIHFAATVVIWTAAELMQAPFTQAVIADLAPVSMRARYMGVFTMSWSAAMMFGAPAGGYMLDKFGGQTLWFSCFYASIVAAAIFVLVMPGIRAPRHIAEPGTARV